MKHFLDLGAHKFEGLGMFTERLKIDKNWNVYSFEGDPNTHKASIEEVYPQIKDKYNSLESHNIAIMPYDGTVTFHSRKDTIDASTGESLGRNFTEGSTAVEKPISGRGAPEIGIERIEFEYEEHEVECLDINTVLTGIVEYDPDAVIYIKMDIEGSEFGVLPKLIESSHLKHVTAIWIEWHERFWEGEEFEQRRADRTTLTEQLQAKDVFVSWHV